MGDILIDDKPTFIGLLFSIYSSIFTELDVIYSFI